MMIPVFDRVENTVGKGENADSQHFSPFPTMYSKGFFLGVINPFPNNNSSKLKEFADDNIKFGENGRKVFRQVENTAGKGAIARYEQFLLFPHCFSKDLCCRHVKTRACLGEGLKSGLCGKRLKHAYP